MPSALSWVLLGLTLLSGPLQAAAQGPSYWLDKMEQATRGLNFDGTFVYQSGGWMQTLRIVHRAGPDGGQERLIALNGPPREVFRDGQRVTCVLPKDRMVVVGRMHPRMITRGPSFRPRKGYLRYYHLSSAAGGRVAGRETELIQVEPIDDYRYGYALFIDRSSGLLLRSNVFAPGGHTLEQVEYTSIATPATIPEKSLEPEISGKGFRVFRSRPMPVADAPGQGEWKVAWLPRGFHLTDHESDPLPTSGVPVERMAYGDGLALVSIYIQHLRHGADALDGPSHMGAVNAYGRMIDGYQVTVVGEVPARTVAAIARSIRRR